MGVSGCNLEPWLPLGVFEVSGVNGWARLIKSDSQDVKAARLFPSAPSSWGGDGTWTSGCAINREQKRSDRWTDGFSILPWLPVHLQLTPSGEEREEDVEGNDLCRSIRPNCFYSRAWRRDPAVSGTSGQLGIQCLDLQFWSAWANPEAEVLG